VAGSLDVKAKYGRRQVLGPVAETLLVAVLLHALLALVLVDLGLTAFLDGAHGVFGRG
jgi:hypothetical protein